MAKATEGIALLSMYGDDEEEDEATSPTMEEEAAVATKEEEAADASPTEDEGHGFDDENLNDNYNRNDYQPKPFDSSSYSSPQPLTSPSPLRFLDDSHFKTLISPFLQRTPTPQRAVTPQRALTPQLPASRSLLSSPSILTSPSPSTLVAPHFIQKHSDEQRTRRISMAIVDYAHDEAAMSPDSEVMEIENNGRVVFGVEIHVSNENIEGTTPVSSQLLTPSSAQEPVLSLDARCQSKYEASIAMEFCGTESEVFEVKASPTSINMQIDEPLQSFLPPTVTTKCSEELQEKINKFLTYKKAGKSFNADLRNRKDYRNPNFLQHAVSYQDIDEIGTCFSKEVFDPHGYDQSDYYDEIEADMKRELERKEQERKKSQKIDFISGTAQPVGVAPATKMNAPSPASSVSTLLNSSLPPNSSTSDASRDCRTNKKSKWDKVDGDTKIHSGGHDNPPNVSVHAAHLTAANAGTGYSAFAQLKRREAEERKSGERKFDKRS